MTLSQNFLCTKIDYLYAHQSYLTWELSNSSVLQRLVEDNERAIIPVFSTKVQCGLFGISDDHIENYLSLDERFLKNRKTSFIFQMEGDSMEPFINHDDYLIVDRSLTHFMNRIVVVDVYDERMCKLLTKEQGRVILRSLNPRYKDIVVTDESEMRIFGVGILCFRDLLHVCTG
jgi:DNA polymerase V